MSNWPWLLQKTKSALLNLDDTEKRWIKERLQAIESYQQSLDELFRQAGGVKQCTVCEGACCGSGRHHLTLANLLTYLLEETEPPDPDPDSPCPYLGSSGCVLPVRSRPYNCITFFCEQLDDRLNQQKRERLRELDRLLRAEYQRLAARYPAASMSGIWIAAKQIGDGSLLGN